MNMNTKKKLRKRIALALASIMLLTGCQSGTVSESVKSSAAPVNMEPTSEFVIYRPPYCPDWLNQAITLFREVYRDVHVTFEDFSTGGTDEERVAAYNDRVNNELLVGGGPDIIFPQYLTVNSQKAMQYGVYMNLTPFFEQDENFHEEDYINGIFDAGRYRGGQYVVPVYVIYPNFMARTPVLEELGISQVETGSMAAFLRQMGEASDLAERQLGYPRMMISSDWFSMFFEFSNLRLIDYENRQVCPDPDSLREFLEAYKTYYPWDYANGEYIPGVETDAPWMPLNYCYEPIFQETEMFRKTSAAFQDADGSYVDFILRDMDGKIAASYQYYVAVPSSSKNPLNAYRFIQIMLSLNIQARKRSVGGVKLYECFLCPVNKEALGMRTRDRMDEPEVRFYDAQLKVLATVKSPPPEDFLGHMERILEADTSTLNDPTASQMTWECMEPFFKDEKPYESCFDELKSKLTIYMDE